MEKNSVSLILGFKGVRGSSNVNYSFLKSLDMGSVQMLTCRWPSRPRTILSTVCA